MELSVPDDRIAFFGDLSVRELAVTVGDCTALLPPETQQLLDSFNRYGFALIRILNTTRLRAQLLSLRSIFGRIVRHDRSLSDGIAPVAPSSLYPGFQGTSRASHSLHTDGAYDDAPPRVMTLLCRIAAPSGGETLLASAKALVDRVHFEAGDDAHSLYSRRALAVGRAGRQSTGPILFRLDQARIGIRFRDDETTTFWQSEQLLHAVSRIRAFLSDKQCVARFRLMPNEILVTDNLAVLHGRTSIPATERRLLWRLNFDGSAAHAEEVIFGFRSIVAPRGSGTTS